MRNQPSFSVTWRTVGSLHARAVRENADRQSRIIDALQPQFGARLLIVPKFDPVEGNVAALQEIADRIGLRRFTLSVEPYDSMFHDKAPTSASLFRLAYSKPWATSIEELAWHFCDIQSARCGRSGGSNEYTT